MSLSRRPCPKPPATGAIAALALLTIAGAPDSAQPAGDAGAAVAAAIAQAGQRLVAAYPDHLAAVDGNALVWRDGTRTPLDDGLGAKSPEAWLDTPDAEDMLQQPYLAGTITTAPEGDPGRARNAEFFARMYGDCAEGGTARDLVDVVWLPRKYGRPVRVTRINGVAERLAAVSRELDQLPATFDHFLKPPAGTYNCRVVAGTTRTSAHGYGIAIDIATGRSDDWRWPLPKGGKGPAEWRNRIPYEIVAVFEKHGFIWGGKWRHFDTMHFEYRPELLPPTE